VCSSDLADDSDRRSGVYGKVGVLTRR